MLVNKNLLGLYNGVSQQPASMRLDSQCEAQENAVSSLARGLFKRPPREFVGLLNSSCGINSFYHLIERDENEKYLMMLTGDATNPIEVHDLNGNKMTIRYGHLDASLNFTADAAVKAYITASNPQDTFKAVTVADYTIIVNTTLNAGMKAGEADSHLAMGLVWVKNAVSTIYYSVYYDNTEYTYQAASGDSATIIASHLVDTMTAAGISCYHENGIIVIYKMTGEFTLRVSDSWGNQAMIAIKDTAQKFSDLPAWAPDGFTVEVTGDNTNSFDNYYVKFVQGSGNGVWKETRKWGELVRIDTLGMPHRLVRTAAGQFTFADIAWEPRVVGDNVSAPEPSFIGNKIKDIFFMKNRLGFASGENIILSRAGDFFNFFPSTALDVLDDDPIDRSISSNQVSTIDWAAPFNESLLLFGGGKHQFILHSSNNMITPSTIACDPTTDFDYSTKCRPSSAGSNVYFVSPREDYSSVREYFVQTDSLVNDAADVTAHCPKYIPNGVRKIVSCPVLDTIFAFSPDEPHSIYVYKYYWQGDQKAQSSWSKWIVDDTILTIDVVGSTLYVLVAVAGQVSLEKIRLEV
jgi:hypothetical protein